MKTAYKTAIALPFLVHSLLAWSRGDAHSAVAAVIVAAVAVSIV